MLARTAGDGNQLHRLFCISPCCAIVSASLRLFGGIHVHDATEEQRRVRIAVFGGTGSLGWQVVRYAVEAEYGCKVLSRRADKMPEVPGVQFVQGDAQDGGKVMLTLTGCEAAVIALGTNTKGQEGLLPTATSLVLAGMRKLEISRVIVVSRIGVGESSSQLPLTARVAGSIFKKKEFAEKEEQERLIRESGTEWTIVRPAGFLEGDATGRYSVESEGRGKTAKITREDTADFIIRELSAGEYSGQVVGLSGK